MFRKILGDAFVRNNAIFFVGSLIVAVLNYAFHPVLSRMMSVEDFGEVQALISLSYITGIILVIFRTITINITSHKDDGTYEDATDLLGQLHKVAFYSIGALILVFLVSMPVIASELRFGSALSFVPLVFVLLAGVPLTFYAAYLQGEKDFVGVSMSNILMAFSKVLFAVVLVWLGFRVIGAMVALVLASVVALGYVFYRTRDRLRLSLRTTVRFTDTLKGELSYGLLILCSVGFITVLYTSDVLMVKYFFPPEEAGLYSGIATIARIIFFATASVAAVLLPSIKRSATPAENSSILRKALGIISLIGVGALGMFFLVPELIVQVLIGGKYDTLSSLLPIAGLYIFLVSVINLLSMYLLALRDRRVIWISCVGLIGLVALCALRHESVITIVWNYVIVSVVTLIILAYSLISKKSYA